MLLSTVIYFRIYSEGLADWKVKTLRLQEDTVSFRVPVPRKVAFPLLWKAEAAVAARS